MFATYRLCGHPEYVQPLLAEAEAMLKLPTADHYKSVPLMESFLREAARHEPLDSRKPPSLILAAKTRTAKPLTHPSLCPA